MIEKSASAFRTISEVADDIGVAQHVLRFWETKFTAVKPLKRGGNRRYYRPEDVDLLRTINRLLYADGYTIKGVQKLLKEKGAKGLGEATPVAPAPAMVESLFARAEIVHDDALLASLQGIRNRLAAALAEAKAA